MKGELAKEILGSGKKPDEPDDEAKDEGGGESDGVVAMRAIGAALDAKDYAGAWDAMRSAVELCSFDSAEVPLSPVEPPEDE